MTIYLVGSNKSYNQFLDYKYFLAVFKLLALNKEEWHKAWVLKETMDKMDTRTKLVQLREMFLN